MQLLEYLIFLLILAAFNFLFLYKRPNSSLRRALLTSGLLFFVGLCIIYFSSNLSKYSGTAKFQYRQNGETMDKLTVTGPYNYYYIDWMVVNGLDNKRSTAGKGYSRFNLYEGIHTSTNYYYTNDLPLDAINKKLEHIEIDKPYLIWEKKYKEDMLPSQLFIIITNKLDFYDEKKLMEIASEYK